MNAQQLFRRALAVESASGNSGDIGCSIVGSIAIDIGLLALGGSSPGVTFAWERAGLSGAYVSVWSSGAQTGAASLAASIGPGLATAHDPGLTGRLKWTVTGTGLSTTVSAQLLSTTVTTGANSATQTLGSTAGLLPGDTLNFATAGVTRTVQSVTNATTVVLTAAVNSTTSEAVTSVASQQQVVTDTTGMTAGDTLHFATAAVDVVIVSVVDANNVIVATPVASTNTEVVTTAGPYVPFSALITGR